VRIDSVEILYCIASSADRRGRRVLVRERGVENVLWPGEDIQNIDIELLGITQRDQKQIEAFLRGIQDGDSINPVFP